MRNHTAQFHGFAMLIFLCLTATLLYISRAPVVGQAVQATATLIPTAPPTATPTIAIFGTSTPTSTTGVSPSLTPIDTPLATWTPTAPPRTTASPTSSPLPGATSTTTATATPLPLVQSITLPVRDGWASQFAERLSALEQLESVTTSDDERWQIGPQAFTAFEFEKRVPDQAKIQSVQVWVEHTEDPNFVTGALHWQVGVGTLDHPTILHEDPALLQLEAANEQVVAWDVTAWVNTAAQINDLKVLIDNRDPNQSTWLDQIYVIVTYIADATPPATATPPPDSYNLQGHVTLEERPTPPDPRWVMPITVNLRTDTTGNTPSTRGFALTTDSKGSFQLPPVQPGNYQLAVKGSHTLQRVITVTVQDTLTSADMGLLREGDAVNDNRINIFDFSRLASRYGYCATATNYLATADFNQDGCINEADIALLQSNFGQIGEIFSTTPVQSASSQAPIPLGVVSNKQRGERFTVMVSYTNLTRTAVDAAAIYLTFDPAYLQVLALAGNPALSTPLVNQSDNRQGQAIYAAGAVGDGIIGLSTLALITFEARQAIRTTPLLLELSPTHQSAVAYHGQSLTTGSSARAPEFSSVEVILVPRLFLPVVKVN